MTDIYSLILISLFLFSNNNLREAIKDLIQAKRENDEASKDLIDLCEDQIKELKKDIRKAVDDLIIIDKQIIDLENNNGYNDKKKAAKTSKSKSRITPSPKVRLSDTTSNSKGKRPRVQKGKLPKPKRLETQLDCSSTSNEGAAVPPTIETIEINDNSSEGSDSDSDSITNSTMQGSMTVNQIVAASEKTSNESDESSSSVSSENDDTSDYEL